MEAKDLKEIVETINLNHSEVQIKYSSNLIHPQLKCVSIKDEAKAITGHGMDLQEKMALIKAYAEFYERSVFKECRIKKSTNGFAAHKTIDLAKEAAYAELIERDALLLTWFNSIAPFWLSEIELADMGFEYIIGMNSHLRANGFEIIIGILAKTGLYYTVAGVLCNCESSTNVKYEIGLSLDVASSQNLFSAVTKAFHGACFAMSIIQSRINARLPLFKELKEEEVKSTQDHFEYYLNPKNRPVWYFSKRQTNIFLLSEFTAKVEIIPSAFKPCFPLFVACATGPEHQEFFVGKSSTENINSSRLLSCSSQDSQINLQLHPLP